MNTVDFGKRGDIMNKHLLFKKGTIVRHLGKNWKGVVIDWGKFNGSHKFVISDRDIADSIRVWTRGGTIEVWKTDNVSMEENELYH